MRPKPVTHQPQKNVPLQRANRSFRWLICVLIILLIGSAANAQYDSTTGFTKYVVDKSKKKNTAKSQQQQQAAAMLLPPPEGCTLNGSTTVTGGGIYTYLLICSETVYADYWGITGGTIIDTWGDEVTVQWCSNSCGSGSVRAYTYANGLIATKNVTISSPPTLNGGSISNPTQTINYNSVPAQINASVASGGSCGGAYSYQWQKSLDAEAGFTDIAGATGQNYQPGSLTATTYYRRKVTCGTTAYTSNIATITVAGALYGGYVTNPNQAIQPNTTPAQINATLPTGGNCGSSYTYQWMSATDANPTFVNISGATGQNYQPGPLTVTTYFNRKTTCNGEVAYLETTGTVTILQPLNAGCITTSNQTITYGNLPDTIKATPATYGNCNGNYSYQWQQSADNVYFVDIPGATLPYLSFSSPLTQTTWFQRKATCGSEVKYTGSVSVTMVSYCSSEKTGVSVTNTVVNNFTVSWTNPANYLGTEVRYRVLGQTEWKTPNADGNATGNFNGSFNAFSFTSGFSAGVTYEIRVRNQCVGESMSNGVIVSGQATAVPQPVTITLRNMFAGSPFPASITVKFKQGSTVVQTNTYPSTSNGTVNIILLSGTYQMEFTMPSGFSSYYIAYDKNNPFEFWDNGGSGLVVVTGNVTFNGGTAYTITASNAIP